MSNRIWGTLAAIGLACAGCGGAVSTDAAGGSGSKSLGGAGGESLGGAGGESPGGAGGAGGESPGGAGGAGGESSFGGAGDESFAGSGGEQALPSQGSITLNVRPPTGLASGSICPDPGRTYSVGLPAPSTATPGGSLVDGDLGTHVTCAIQGTGPFTFSGSLEAIATAGSELPIRVVFSDGSIGAGFTGTASVSIYTPTLGGDFASTSCTIQVINSQIKPGSIWASFDCPTVSNAPSGLCSASGVFVFENCLGS